MKLINIMPLTCFLFALGCVGDYESLYESTPAGRVEVKTLPERLSLEAQAETDYFKGDNDLFMKLFRYIDKNKVAMTVPVEAEIHPGRMRFFAGKDIRIEDLADTDLVAIKSMPERKVVSVGMKGKYSVGRFNDGVKMLTEWLEDHPALMPVGDPYAVYWDGPFTWASKKRSEVHQVVVER